MINFTRCLLAAVLALLLNGCETGESPTQGSGNRTRPIGGPEIESTVGGVHRPRNTEFPPLPEPDEEPGRELAPAEAEAAGGAEPMELD